MSAAVLADYFASCSPVSSSRPDSVSRRAAIADDPRRLLVGMLNNDLFADWQGTLQVRLGSVTSALDILNERPLPVDNPLPMNVPAGDAVILDLRW